MTKEEFWKWSYENGISEEQIERAKRAEALDEEARKNGVILPSPYAFIITEISRGEAG